MESYEVTTRVLCVVAVTYDVQANSQEEAEQLAIDFEGNVIRQEIDWETAETTLLKTKDGWWEV